MPEPALGELRLRVIVLVPLLQRLAHSCTRPTACTEADSAPRCTSTLLRQSEQSISLTRVTTLCLGNHVSPHVAQTLQGAAIGAWHRPITFMTQWLDRCACNTLVALLGEVRCAVRFDGRTLWNTACHALSHACRTFTRHTGTRSATEPSCMRVQSLVIGNAEAGHASVALRVSPSAMHCVAAASQPALARSRMQAINTCARLPVRRSVAAAPPTADKDDPNVADVLYHSAVSLLSLLATSDDLASIGLAFYGAAPTLARTLRAPRTLRDWGARVVVLALAARVATVDDDAARQLLREGMLAAVELALHVRRLHPCRCPPREAT